jgi:carboxyl-terminal processing protease
MKKSTRIASYIAIFGIVFVGGLMVGNSLPNKVLSTNYNSNTNVLETTTDKTATQGDLNLNTLWEVRKLLKDKYIHTENLKDQEMAWGAVKGMVSALNDPYTEYMDPKETKDFDEGLNSELQGIGAELTVKNQLLTVVSTVKDSPAQKAGLQPNDVVYKIDGKTAADMTLYDAITSIRGEPGTSVTLSLLRKGKDKPFDLSITRQKITVASVTSEEKEKGIWHVSINQFSDDTKAEFNRIMDEIKTKNPKGIILDLRFNGGGYLEGAVDILSSFIRGDKTVVNIEYRDQTQNENLKTSGNAQFPDLPLVVLINKGSASASEIVSLAIQELKRGVLIGEQSFGKGTVQEVDPLPDGSSLRYTIAKWNSPGGKNVNGVGIKPDIEVAPKEGDDEKNIDRQLDAAVNYLKNL